MAAPDGAGSNRLDRLLRLALGADPHDVPDQAELLQQHDHHAGRVGHPLPEAQAVKGRGGERVVVVMPRLAHRERRQPEDVARLILDVEAPATEEVADGVDRPGHVVQDEHADQAGPQQRRQRGADAAAHDPADGERDHEPEHRPQRKQPVDDLHGAVLDHVGSEALALGGADRFEQPADVGVIEALGGIGEACPVSVRRMRVAVLIGERVVLAMVGDPDDHRALNGHRAHHRQHRADGLGRLQRAMGERPVVAERDPERGDHVQDDHHHQLQRPDRGVPQQHDRGEQADERQRDPEQVHHFVSACHRHANEVTSRARNFLLLLT